MSGSPSKATLNRPPQWWYYVPVLVVITLCLVGCVRRRMTIRSNPPGALVYVDDYEIGTTPVSVNFTNYGTRKIRLVKDGYETPTVMQPISPPWYEIPPLDFISENLIPGELRDQRMLCYQLRPQIVVPREQLLARAEDLRARGQVPAAMAPPVLSSPPPVHTLPSSGGASQPLESIPTPQAEPPHTRSQPMQPFVPGAQPMQPSQPQVAPGHSAPTFSWGQPGQSYPSLTPQGSGNSTGPQAGGGTSPGTTIQRSTPPGGWTPPPAPASPQNQPGWGGQPGSPSQPRAWVEP